eukprot:snap_masked-scaffold_3-processed-gene-21.23-mRNA-1 protein AED:1.00 eAED:1.00 QI:0/0/0/0/1/1/2/0/68
MQNHHCYKTNKSNIKYLETSIHWLCSYSPGKYLTEKIGGKLFGKIYQARIPNFSNYFVERYALVGIRP